MRGSHARCSIHRCPTDGKWRYDGFGRNRQQWLVAPNRFVTVCGEIRLVEFGRDRIVIVDDIENAVISVIGQMYATSSGAYILLQIMHLRCFT